jgi:Sugar-transfer associated ATP-grasp
MGELAETTVGDLGSLADKIIAKTIANDVAPSAAPAKSQPILDVEEFVKPLPMPELLMGVMKANGKPLTHLVSDMARLSFAPSRISPEEYFDLRLYDDEALAGADKREFVGMKGCKWIGLEANQNPNWFAIATEKLPFYAVMGAYGLPTIKQRAVYHPRVKLPGINSIPNKDELAVWLRNPLNFPCFGKPVSGSLSLGTVAIDAYDPATDQLTLASGRKVDVPALVEEIRAHYRIDGYMFQERLEPHPELRALTGNRIGTVRVYTIWGEKGPEVFRVCWKVPAGANMADNFWRTGNMLAALDETTGTVKRVIRGTGPRQVEVECHPDTGARLVGATIPGFKDVLDLAAWGARVLNEVPLIGWDIAMTDRGAVLVEANNTPDFRLVQMAERRGVFDARMKAFLARMQGIYAAAGKSNASAARSIRKRGMNAVFRSIRRSA